MANVLWLQGGACSGNTMSFLDAQEPTVVELIVDFGINILWHPTVGLEIGHQVSDLLNDCVSGKTQLDIFVFEGSVIEGAQRHRKNELLCRPPYEGLGKGTVQCRSVCSSHWRLRYLGRYSGSTAQPE